MNHESRIGEATSRRVSGSANQRVSESAGERGKEPAGERVSGSANGFVLPTPYSLFPTSYSLFSDDRGQSLLTQAILLIPVLVLVIGLAYDLGAVAVAQVKLQDVVDLAVLDAARSVNYGLFYVTQDVTLSNDAVQVAQEVVRMHSGDRARLIELQLLRPDDIHTTLRLGAEVEVPMRFLRIIGIGSIKRRAYATSTAAFGISGEGQ